MQATHSDREQIDIQTADSTVRVRSRASRGPSSLVDYLITVPRWMAVNLTGTYLEATIEGTTAEVTVETVNGNIRVVGGSGTMSLRSVQGTIAVDKASGRVVATTVNEGIRLTNVTGDMTAETTNGDIVVDNAQTSSLTASTVNGDVTFNGTVRENGSYRLTTHGGDIRVGLGGATSAIVFIRTFQGDFTADFPIQLPDGQTARSGSKRFNFTLGGGSARIELQSFNGDIVLAKGRIVTPEESREMRRKGIKPGKDLAEALAGAGAPAVAMDHSQWEALGEKIGAHVAHEVDVEFEREVDVEFEHEFEHDFDFEHRLDFEHNRFAVQFEAQPVIVPVPDVRPGPNPLPARVPRIVPIR